MSDEQESEPLSDAGFSKAESGLSNAREFLERSNPLTTYESLVNALPLCLLIKDIQGRRVFANDAYLRVRNTTLSELLGKVDADLFPDDIAKQYTDDDEQVIQSGKTLHSVEPTIDADDNVRWIERIKSPILDDHNVVTGIQLLFWDVTDRIEARKQLDFERHLLTTLLKNLPDSIYFKDLESRFMRISEAMASKSGLQNADDAVGKTDADIFSQEHADRARKDELKIIETGIPLVDEIEKETWPDGEDTWCMSTKMQLHDDVGAVIGTFGISRDITDLIKSQNALREARDQADKANQAKSDFLANMSHEIRTPMNAIIGMSELLAQTKLTHEQHDYVDLVREAAGSLLRLLNDILDFSKIEARRLELESVAFSLRDLVEKTGRTLSIRASEKGLELMCRVAPDLPDRWLGDPGRIRQVLINLVGNGIKFTEHGEVKIEVMLADTRNSPVLELADDQPVMLRFQVQDTGIGIPLEKHEAVLNAFTQVDASTTRRFGGTGLGLAISKQLVELMGGEFGLESVAGVGTKFSFTLPLVPAASGETVIARRLADLEQMPVLVVDDNQTNRRILNEIFINWRMAPTLAESGAQAIQEIKKAENGGAPFRLAVLDCMMPEMDGFQLARTIREKHSEQELKLIILSSASYPDDARRCAEMGIARYMTKPVVQSELLNTVVQVMHAEQSGDTQIVRNELAPCPALRVLVAEDGLANQHVAIGLLKANGHRVSLACDGQEAVNRWSSETFDAILMDMHMPEMDGLEATRTIRQREQGTGNHIPIIALTAAALPEDAAACREAGMDDFLSKPIQPPELQAMLAKYAPDPTLSEDESTVDTSEILDLDIAGQRIAGGQEGLVRLAKIFELECKSIMQTLHESIAANDLPTVHRSAHTLKGSANLFAAKRVSGIATEIEQKAKAGEADDIPRLLDELEPETHRLLSMLRKLVAEQD